MFDKDRISIDITQEDISIIIGNRYKVTSAITIDTPEDTFDGDGIIDVTALANIIQPYVKKAKVKEVCFVIRGDDVITRQFQLPVMKEEAMADSVKWELKQFVGERVNEFVVSYEIVSSKNEQKDGNCSVLMVAAETFKVKKYMDLAAALELIVVAIDVPSNITARMLRNYENIYAKGTKSVGVIDLSATYTSLAIVEMGKLALDRFQGYGLTSGAPEIITNKMDYEIFLNSIDLEDNMIDEFSEGRLQTFLDSISAQFTNFIQFYSSGKIKKTLDKIYILGSGMNVKGIDKYFEGVFNAPIEFIPTFDDFKFSIKLSNKVDLKDFFYCYGMLLRTDKNELNLIPPVEKKEIDPVKAKNALILSGCGLVALMVLGVGYSFGMGILLNLQKEKLTAEINENRQLIQKHEDLSNRITLITQHIDFAAQSESLKSKGTAEYINGIKNNFTSNVTIENINYSEQNVIITGKTTKQEEIDKLWANLRENKEYSNAHIGSITEEEGGFKFTLEVLKPEGVVTNE